MDDQTLWRIETRARLAYTGQEWEVVGNTVYFAPQWWIALLGALPVADFIAHSRADVLALVAEVRRLNEALETTVEALKHLCPPVEGTEEETAALAARLAAEARAEALR